ncbi:hypothetical protein H8356DRAFT_1340072 [Neocallimastix lanati (nom. inval.)]|nr:hypothetical protein H8356DRAFT_1340072 [Neocallimastix sp. JGI-2020a]
MLRPPPYKIWIIHTKLSQNFNNNLTTNLSITSRYEEENKIEDIRDEQSKTGRLLSESCYFRSAQLALCQIESLILQINQNISNFEHTERS